MTKKFFYSAMIIALFSMIFVRGASAGITISPTTLKLKVGQTATLTVTHDTANFSYGVHSLNTRIATVNPPDGAGTTSFTVTAVAPGTTKIQVRTLISGSYVAVAECVVTVRPDKVWPESATLNPDRLTLKIGEQTSIRANVLPADFNQGTPQWRINHEQLVHVTPNGLFATVKGLVAGTTTLFFTVGNASAKCIITVKKTDEPQPGELKAIVIVPESIGLYAGDRGKFHVKAVPEGATLPALNWKVTEGTSIAKILRSDAGKCYIEGLRPGEAVLTVTAGKLKAEAMISVK